jgi:adenylate cyclase
MALWPAALPDRVAGALIIASAAFAGVTLLRAVGGLEPLELALYDYEIRRAAQAPISEPPITLVLIDEADIRRHGHPLRDETLTTLIGTILAANPRALGVDLYRDLPVPAAETGRSPDYEALGRAVAADDRVVMTMKFPDPDGRGTPPPRFLDTDAQVGFSDLPVDAGGTIRRGLLYLWEGERPRMSLALQLALRYLAAEGIRPAADPEEPDQLLLGATVLPPLDGHFGPYADVDAAGYQFLLDFRWGSRAIPAYRTSQLLDGEFDPARLRDRIVIIGTAAVSVKDSFYTPLSRGAGGATSYGAALHAQAAHQLIRYAHGEGRPLSSPSTAATVGWILLWSLIGAGLGLWNRSLPLQALSLLGLLALILGLGHVLFAQGWTIAGVPALLVLVLSAGSVVAMLAALERAERAELSGLFSRFQGPAVADEIWRRRAEFMGEDGRPVSRRVVLTALMSDLEGYTAASEKMEPEVLMSWVNEYMNSMAALVEEYGGVVDDYAGDGIKANFGFPVPSIGEEETRADAVAAVSCALAMGKRMEQLNESWRERDLPTGRCRVGIFTGPAVVGCIGGDRSLKFTSVGDTVNTAARLEGFAKDDFLSSEKGTAWRILIGQRTMQLIGEAFEVVDIGAHALKGKDEPVPIHRVFGPPPRQG